MTKRLLPFWEYVDTFAGDINTVVDTYSEVYDFYQLITESNAFATKREVAREVGERLGFTAKQVYSIVERNKLVE